MTHKFSMQDEFNYFSYEFGVTDQMISVNKKNQKFYQPSKAVG